MITEPGILISVACVTLFGKVIQRFMAPPSDHPNHGQTQFTSSQLTRPQERRPSSAASERYATRYRNQVRNNDHVRNSIIAQGSSPPPENTHNTHPQTEYVVMPSSQVPSSAAVGRNIFQEPFEIQVRGRLGITGQIREDLALGRLFGVLTLSSADGTPYTGTDGASKGTLTTEQVVSAVSPVPTLDDASDSSPPPPYVAGTLTFPSLKVQKAGAWRLNFSLLRVNSLVAPLSSPQDGVISLGSYETGLIMVD